MFHSTFIQSVIEPWLLFIAADPTLRLVQMCMLGAGILVIFLVFLTTRDVLLRSQSFLFMLFSIVLVAALPLIGFCIYLLIRPARTIKEREIEEMLLSLTSKKASTQAKKSTAKSRSKKS